MRPDRATLALLLCVTTFLRLGLASEYPRHDADWRALRADPFAAAPLAALVADGTTPDAALANMTGADSAALVVAGRLALAHHDAHTAARYWKRVLDARELPSDWLGDLAAVFEQAGDVKSAKRCFTRGLAGLRPGAPEAAAAWLELGGLELQDHDARAAERAFAAAAAATPTDLQLRQHISEREASHGQLPLAIATLEKATRDFSDGEQLVPIRERLGELRARTGDWRGALADYLLAWKNAAPDSGLANELARRAVKIAVSNHAVGQLERELSAKATAGDHVLVGDALLAAGQPARAAEQYRLAKKVDPANVAARASLLKTGIPDARERCQLRYELVSLRPEEPGRVIDLARELFEAGRGDEAMAAIRSGAARFANVAAFLAESGDLLSERSRFAESLHYYEEAARLVPAPAFQEERGRCLVRIGRQADAVAAFRQILRPTPSLAKYNRLIQLLAESHYADDVQHVYVEALGAFADSEDMRIDFAKWLTLNGRVPAAIEQWRILAKQGRKPQTRELADFELRRLERQRLLGR
jgi:tetratricopeptide (TPR) repeat protein